MTVTEAVKWVDQQHQLAHSAVKSGQSLSDKLLSEMRTQRDRSLIESAQEDAADGVTRRPRGTKSRGGKLVQQERLAEAMRKMSVIVPTDVQGGSSSSASGAYPAPPPPPPSPSP